MDTGQNGSAAPPGAAPGRVRVAFFVTALRAAGGTRVIVDLANWAAARGYAVDLLTMRPTGEYVSQIAPGVRLVSLSRRRILLSLVPLMAYLRRERPAAVMPTDELSQLLALGAKLLTRSRTRIVVRVGNMFSILWPTYRGWRDRVLIPALLRRLYPKADAIIAVSQGVAHDLQAFFCLPAEKVTVIFNPKELAYIARRALEPVAHPWLADQTLPVVVAVSRLRAQKDLPTLLRAFAEARRECPSRLLILGKGSDADALEHLARELGIADAVAFLGYVENPHAYTARADIFVSTSRWEGMPNSVVEAIACGVPVVATDCDSGPREILAPDTDPLLRRREGVEWAAYGVLAPVGGVREVAEALTTLLRAPDRRAAYAAAARHRAAAFDACRIVDRYLACMVPQDESGGTGRP